MFPFFIYFFFYRYAWIKKVKTLLVQWKNYNSKLIQKFMLKKKKKNWNIFCLFSFAFLICLNLWLNKLKQILFENIHFLKTPSPHTHTHINTYTELFNYYLTIARVCLPLKILYPNGWCFYDAGWLMISKYVLCVIIL